MPGMDARKIAFDEALLALQYKGGMGQTTMVVGTLYTHVTNIYTWYKELPV